MNIGQAADAAGVTAKRIRYYEQIGLLGAARRSASGYRVYADHDVHTLRFIQRARNLGFSLPQISELLALWQDRRRSSADVKTLTVAHVEALRAKIRELESMLHTLEHLAARCDGDDRPDCPILAEIEGERP